jgi:hypothetical protein
MCACSYPGDPPPPLPPPPSSAPHIIRFVPPNPINSSYIAGGDVYGHADRALTAPLNAVNLIMDYALNFCCMSVSA